MAKYCYLNCIIIICLTPGCVVNNVFNTIFCKYSYLIAFLLVFQFLCYGHLHFKDACRRIGISYTYVHLPKWFPTHVSIKHVDKIRIFFEEYASTIVNTTHAGDVQAAAAAPQFAYILL